MSTLKPLKNLPTWLLLSLPLLLIGLVLLQKTAPNQAVKTENLSEPPNIILLKNLSLNEPALTSRLLSIWLQDFDYQRGKSLNYDQLDYKKLTEWLNSIQELDQNNRYPLLSASHIYSTVKNPEKLQQIIIFVEQQFKSNPEKNWPWMVKMVLLAQHKLQDNKLALRLSQKLMTLTQGKKVPSWVKQMSLSVLIADEQKNAAATLIAALLQGGEIKDPAERRFLQQRFFELQNAL